MKEKNYMKISELVQKSGISRSMIHFYLKEKILHAPIKTSKTMAYYDESHLKRLQTVKRLKMNMKMPTDFLKKQLATLDKSGSATTKNDQIKANDPALQNPKMMRIQQITQSGVKVFSQKGYHRTRVQDVTEDLGISTGTFYLYFKNKQDLFMSVVKDVVNTFVGESAIAIKQETEFLEKLRIRGEIFFNNFTKYMEILSILRGEAPSDEGWAKQILQQIYQDMTKPIIQEIQQAIDDELIYDIDAEMTAYQLFGLIEIMTYRSTLDKKYNYDKIWKSVRNLLTQGLILKKS